MPKVVINKSYEEFFLSHKAFVRLRELGQQQALQEADRGAYWPAGVDSRYPDLNKFGALIPRDDQKLVQVVEELGAEANGHCAQLKIVAVPDHVKWTITKTIGGECVSEVHRTWQ